MKYENATNKYPNLYLELMEYYNQETETNEFFIENGYKKSWCKNEQILSDNGIMHYSTETRWYQYMTGKINREQAVTYAKERMKKQLHKDMEKDCSLLERAAVAHEIDSIYITVRYSKDRNPTATVSTAWNSKQGHATGYGYDLESTAVATAFNQIPEIMNLLYTLKEKGLQSGKSDFSETACTGINNNNICGYGAGYTVIPYFEGGVGVNSFWSILKSCNFKMTNSIYSGYGNVYTLTKEG